MMTAIIIISATRDVFAVLTLMGLMIMMKGAYIIVLDFVIIFKSLNVLFSIMFLR